MLKLNLSLKRKASIFFVLALIIVFFGYRFIYQEHERTADREVVFKGTSLELYQLIMDNESELLDKVVVVSGEVSDINVNGFVLDALIDCRMPNAGAKTPQVGEPFTIKGRFIGYDDLLDEIKLDKCILTLK